MSDTTASLRRKIDSAGDLQSVVRTMKAWPLRASDNTSNRCARWPTTIALWSWG